MVGNEVTVAVAGSLVPNRGDLTVRSHTNSPTADRRPDLHDERTVPRQLDLSCIAGKLMLKSASLPLSRWVRVRR